MPFHLGQRIALGILLTAFFFFQLLTLNSPRLSGDEVISSIYGLESLRTILSGHLPTSLTPVQTYLGPIDMWILGAMAALPRMFHFESMPWLLRLMPLLWTWAGALVLARETRHRSEALSWLVLVISVTWPMNAVHGKVGWPPAFCLGLFSILLSEMLRAERTQNPRWWIIGGVAGLSMEFHPVSAIGIAATLGAQTKLLWTAFKKKPSSAIGGILLALLLAYPELRNYPPPSIGATPANSWFELRGYFNLLSGERPYAWWYGHEALPVSALLAAGFSTLALMVWRWIKLRKETNAWIRPYTHATCAGTLFLLYFCWRGRALGTLGHERYLIAITPLWNLLLAEALWTFASRWNARAVFAFVFALAALQSSRAVISNAEISRQQDPVLLATRWLEARCPAETCVVYTHNFWNYWAMRFYSSDRLAINCNACGFSLLITHPTDGRTLAGCWYPDAQPQILPKKWAETAVFQPGQNSAGQVCYSEISF